MRYAYAVVVCRGVSMGRPPRAAFRPRLADYRRRMGLTQADVADEVSRLAAAHEGRTAAINANTVARHERGVTWPVEVYRRLYCRLYGATEEQLGLVLGSANAGRIDGRGATSDEGGDDVNRREFLRAAGALGLAAALPVGDEVELVARRMQRFAASNVSESTLGQLDLAVEARRSAADGCTATPRAHTSRWARRGVPASTRRRPCRCSRANGHRPVTH